MAHSKGNLFSLICICGIHLCTLLYLSGSASAQEPVFRHYTSEDGLPSSETYCVMQDRKGYMWFGTDRGLTRFNGYEFHTLSTAEGLEDNTIFGLYEDEYGRIWYHSYIGRTGYVRNDSVYTYAYNRVMETRTNASIGTGVMVDTKNRLWFSNALENKSMAYMIDQQGHLLRLSDTTNVRIKDVYLMDNNTKCISSGYHLVSDSIRVISVETGKILYTIHTDRNDYSETFVFKTTSGDVYLYNSDIVWLLKDGIATEVLRYKGKVLSLMVDDGGNIWVGKLHGGLTMYDARSHYRKEKYFLKQYSVSGMTADKEGGLWFTTLESGIYYLPPGFTYAYNGATGLPVSKVLGLENIDDDMVLVLSNWEAAIKYRNRSDLAMLKKPATSAVYDICYVAPDHIYYSGVNGPFNLPFKKKCIFVPAQKKVYVGKLGILGFMGASLNRFDQHGNEKRLIPFDKFARVTCLFAKDDETLLIGTLKGLYFFANDSLKTLYAFNPLLQHRVSAISRLDSKHIVVATVGAGIYIVTENDYTHLIHYTVKDGLPSMMCNALLCDKDSVVWVGTNRGLCRITDILDPVHMQSYKMDISNGIVSDEINDLCMLHDTLWVATMNGLSLIPKSVCVKNAYRVPLYIENIMVNGEYVHLQEQQNFNHDQNNISISFAGLSYLYAGKLAYKYRLKGIDARWNLTSNRTVIYSALAPGRYIFELKAIDPNGVESPEALVYAFVVLPPFWQTWWFMSLVVAIFILALYLFIRYRVRFLQNQAKIRHDLDGFRDKALRAQMNPHFIYNSMNAIQNYIRKSEVSASTAFLSKFSLLMRLTFNNSGAETVPLNKDLEALTLYAEMENMRFPGKFNLHLSVDETIAQTLVTVPPLLIQPFVENAILHGFGTKTGAGNIWVTIRNQGDRLEISVKDDGVGRDKALQIAQRKSRYIISEERKDSGISITVARIGQAWGRKAFEGMFRLTDLFDDNHQPSGTLITFYLPIHHDQSNNR